MILYLTSSPCIDGADRAILNPQNDFLDRLRCDLPVNSRCLYIAADPENRDATCEFGAAMFCAFAEAGFHFSSYHILDAWTADQAAELIANSDFIILSGGHVPTQNAFFREIGLAGHLQDFPGVIMGISAGSMNAARIAYLQPEEPGESHPSFRRFAPGLGLTEVNICPHYQKVKHMILDGKRLFEDITYRDSRHHTFYALPDGSYFYIDEDQTLLCGKAWRIRNGILEKLTEDGDTLDISQIR